MEDQTEEVLDGVVLEVVSHELRYLVCMIGCRPYKVPYR